jgi:hypothetical protein
MKGLLRQFAGAAGVAGAAGLPAAGAAGLPAAGAAGTAGPAVGPGPPTCALLWLKYRKNCELGLRTMVVLLSPRAAT